MAEVQEEVKQKLDALYGLAEEAVAVTSAVKLTIWHRKAKSVLVQAVTYDLEQEYERAYVLYLRFGILVAQTGKHPEAPRPEHQQERQRLKKKCIDVLDRCQQVKDLLRERYTKKLSRPPTPTAPVTTTGLGREEDDLEARLARLGIAAPPSPPSFEPPPPPVDRTRKPTTIPSIAPAVAPAADLWGLRDVVVPLDISSWFLSLAATNTTRNCETCGVLAGTLHHGRLQVTHLLIPRQTGSSDSCAATNEEELFLYQDAHNLLTLGWIHTHPSQTCFLSSVDLHNHCAYQLMLPEAIAIVCSPKTDRNETYSLTGYGLSFISKCTKSGFHPHPTEPVLYEANPAHVKYDNVPLEVVDMRVG